MKRLKALVAFSKRLTISVLALMLWPAHYVHLWARTRIEEGLLEQLHEEWPPGTKVTIVYPAQCKSDHRGLWEVQNVCDDACGEVYVTCVGSPGKCDYIDHFSLRHWPAELVN